MITYSTTVAGIDKAKYKFITPYYNTFIDDHVDHEHRN